MPRHNTPSDRAIQPHIDENTKIVTNRTQVDNGVYSPVYREKEEYKTDRHLVDEWEQIVHEKHYGKLTDNHKKTLKALCDNMDAQGVGSPSLDTLLMSIRKNNDAMIHKNTLIKMLRELVEFEIVGKDAGPRRNIPRNQTPPKRYTLLNLHEPRDSNNKTQKDLTGSKP